MTEKVSFAFYRVQQCGFYKRGNAAPEFGNFVNTLAELAKWSKGLDVSKTKLLQASDNSKVLGVYLAGVEQSGDMVLITLWNEVPANSDNKLASIPANQPVGKAKMVMNAVAHGTIPGYPTYFLAIPSLGVLATLRFDSPLLGQSDLREYIEQFLATASSHSDSGESSSLEVRGYRKDSNGPVRTDVYPRFRTMSYTHATNIQFLLNNSSRVTHVHRKIKLGHKGYGSTSAWQSVLEFLKLSKGVDEQANATVKFTMQTAIDRDGMLALINEWKQSNESAQSDYGFTLQGDSTIYWLSGVRVKGELHLDVERDINSGQINTKSLLSLLTKYRNTVLTMLP
ncbi:MAG: hypothetical protein Q4B94_01775 [Pseudomonadota bacterium]|nr:hypothetical protein [Pseudomonadota bacterium]